MFLTPYIPTLTTTDSVSALLTVYSVSDYWTLSYVQKRLRQLSSFSMWRYRIYTQYCFRLATVPCMGGTFMKAVTKVVRPRSDWGSRYTDHNSIAVVLSMHRRRSKQRDGGSSTNSCHHIFGHKDNSITIVSRSQTVYFCTRVWLCKTTITNPMMS